MQTLPETGFLRLKQIIGDPTATPPIPAIIPVKKTCWWDGVKSGRFPASVKSGARLTMWRVQDIRDLISTLTHNTQDKRSAACFEDKLTSFDVIQGRFAYPVTQNNQLLSEEGV